MLIKNAIKLEEKDRKILHELDTDARQAYLRIGKKVGLSMPTVKSRIENLMQRGLLTGFLTVINTEKLGYAFFNIYLKTRFPSWEEEQKFINYLKRHPNVGWFASFSGAWSMKAGIMARDRQHFNTISQEISNRLEKNLIDSTTTQPVAAYVCKHKFLDDTKIMDGGFYHITCPVELDTQDLKILSMLDANPRAPVLEIAKATEISHPAVIKRIKRLLHTGVIQEFRPIIDLQKLGYQWYHVLFRFHNIDNDDKKQFIQYLKEHPKVFYIIDLIGACNLVAEFLTDGGDDFTKIIKELKDRFPEIIHSYEPLLITKEHKHSYFPKDMLQNDE
jgi:DNA-binding Lrp family transcriptional regulator